MLTVLRGHKVNFAIKIWGQHTPWLFWPQLFHLWHEFFGEFSVVEWKLKWGLGVKKWGLGQRWALKDEPCVIVGKVFYVSLVLHFELVCWDAFRYHLRVDAVLEHDFRLIASSQPINTLIIHPKLLIFLVNHISTLLEYRFVNLNASIYGIIFLVLTLYFLFYYHTTAVRN